jgi:hypothetical protein
MGLEAMMSVTLATRFSLMIGLFFSAAVSKTETAFFVI